ncbi:ketoacyl-ACP synthase III [Danxiaibacter flavus]|uniref:Ketoacyl-ACP synthase III n=1 Tax=Danxiaibacter flavus TaxID=3049108 RepID=A0ABV3ZEY9_9BACT|nr:ketoacyl-ACP synthase III [Chitinophagaceae bacterium DXS]
MDVQISAISYWLPEQVLTNEEINRNHPTWEIEKTSIKTGIRERRVAGEQSTGDLAYMAAVQLFNEHKIAPDLIDFVLLCTQTPDFFLPTTACILQNRLGLKKSCGALDVGLGCSGYVYCLGLAKGLVQSGSARNVLLITADTLTKLLHKDDKSSIPLFGDAATATLVSCEQKGIKIGNCVYGSDGEGANNLIVKNGANKHKPMDGIDIYDNENEFVRNDNNLYMDGTEIFKFTASNVPPLIKRVLEQNMLSRDEVDLFVFHQANKYMLDFVRKKIGIEPSKFFYHLERSGNTTSSTIPIALKEAMIQNKMTSNSKVVLAGFGVGYSWAACVLGN